MSNIDQTSAAVDEKWQAIAAIDLRPVRQKFAFKKSWLWHLGHSADQIEAEYRQFLYLVVTNPGKTVIPWSRDLDDFWHEHILDTAKYAADCDTIWGKMIHHNPHVPEGSAMHSAAAAETREMYLAAFKERLKQGKKRRPGSPGCGVHMPVVYSDNGPTTGSHHGGHGGGHGGSHGGGHGGGHGCGGHGCGGHGGH